ncbi:similar to Saccharomyces cerevisiae YJL070C Putative protein of unknown function with similarity to AMP deaminases [Maudiozyma barnettii]|uniref:Inactive deaminase YJL070C n=1 Tax=Maudiozyma barnettii TaxID=61262 RepID=A0A8H2VKA9_9SACH|nr:metallo-dependent hydrolase superfamily protein [Kazachstania barnettii]CAB4256933.1 similar to Saccharomyces cerevisiae YJL070C Putative protein of unknown function with similarity to AMP deaminases [Kazachstania barnettii]CAD1785538.1 similar to Saccharomyces cerevisiae YJL070C Putative protein of unknown function with similarity to AMP deaminases [Kazachstania barnettii]
MYTDLLERGPSLLLDDYQQNVVIPSKNSKKPLSSQDAEELLKNKKILSIDDIDMIDLRTVFDDQMICGSPMYFDSDPEENNDPITLKDTNPRPNSALVPSMADCYGDVNGNIFKELRVVRGKYIRGSFQDCVSDMKNDLDRWLVYPKPLPKFWKFEKDNRFKEKISQSVSSSDIDLTSKDLKKVSNHGFYYPHNIDEEYFLGRKKKNPHYTGEYFNIHLYEKASHKNMIKHSLLRFGNERRDIPSFKEFRHDLTNLIKVSQTNKINQISERRLVYLKDKFELFQFLKQKSEILENKNVPYRDFYNSRKVDLDLLLSGCMGRRQLSEYIWEKLNNEPDRIVCVTEYGKPIRLNQFFENGKNVDKGDCIPVGLKLIDDDFLEWYKDVYLVSYHLFCATETSIRDSLKGKHYRYYLLAKTFLEFDNHIDGEYLAEIFTRFCLHTLEKSKYQLAQVSVDYQYTNENGSTSDNWWKKFSSWLMKYNLISYNVRWNIRFSRCYSPLFALGKVKNFQDFINLIFNPLLEAMNSDDINFQFTMRNICSFDLVINQTDDYLWKVFEDTDLEPNKWTAGGDNPTISQYMYAVYNSLSEINQIRHNCFQNTIVLRSYCCPYITKNRTSQFSTADVIFNEQIESLACNLLLCNGGLLQSEPIWEAPSLLLYMYYLFQIPMVVSPLSSVSHGTTLIEDYHNQEISNDEENIEKNFVTERREENKLRNLTVINGRSYNKNPFMSLFKIGFKVSLSSESVLFNSSYTQEPMMEEYSVAASIYLLNAADLCELTRNSVLFSGYDGWYKSHWIGAVVRKRQDEEVISEPIGMLDVWYDKERDTRERHNVPFLRRCFRNETLAQEWMFTQDDF